MTWRPAMLHDSKVYQEFQRLANYLNGTGSGTPSGGSALLGIRGTYKAFAISGGDNANLDGSANSSVAWDAATEELTGEAFGDIGTDEIFEFTTTGVYHVTAFVEVGLEDTAAVTAVTAGVGLTFDADVESIYNIFAPTLSDGQYTSFVIQSPIFSSDAGDRVQVNPNLNSQVSGEQWYIDSSSHIYVVKLA